MPKRTLRGVVVKDQSDKTVVVDVERRFTHPVLKKTVRETKKYHAHDEGNVFKTGDRVLIEETRPISRKKCWLVIGRISASGEVLRGTAPEPGAGVPAEPGAGAAAEAEAGAAG